MIQPNSMLEALQRGLYGLGGIGTALEDKKKNDAALAQAAATKASTEASTAGQVTDNQQKALTFQGAMKQRQLLDALGGNEAETKQLQSAGPQDPLNGAAGPLLPGQDRTPGVLSDAGTAKLATMPDEHARLIAQLQRENGQFDATPEMVKAKHAASLTQTQNAVPLSNQAVAAGQTANDTAALGLGTAKATQPADIASKNQEPSMGRAKMGLLGAQTNEANAKAAKDSADAAAGGDAKTIASIEHQAKERFDKAGKETGFDGVRDNWANIQSAIQQANDPKAKDKVAADYTLLDQYLKMVNPGMGVRSSNMEMFANSMGLSDKLKSGMLKVQQGGKFDPDVRNAVLDMAKGIYANHEKSYLEKLNSIDEGLSATPGANRERVFGKTMADKISGSTQPAPDGLDETDMALIAKHKPKAANAGQ